MYPNQAAYFVAGGGNSSLIHEIALLAQQACPQTRVVALLNSMDPHPLSSTPLAGYCFKDEINESILHLLRAIAAGATWVSGGVAARLRDQASALPEPCLSAILNLKLGRVRREVKCKLLSHKGEQMRPTFTG